MAEKQTIIRPYEGFQERFVRSNLDLVIGGGSLGAGKYLSINELVLTPNGWVKNGDLKLGDLVCTPFGNPAPIVGIYDHKDKDIYEFITDDGRMCECGIEHLWSFRTKKQLHKYRIHKDYSRNITTEDTASIIKRMDRGEILSLPLPRAIEFNEKDYLIPPYVLGVMLGDGCLTDKNFLDGNSLTISNSEDDIVEKVAAKINAHKIYRDKANYSNVFYFNGSKKCSEYIKKEGLNVCSYEKFIPKEYLWGSIEQRKQLLHGLMDTDGNVGLKNRFSYYTTSPQLRDDFIYLCRSLGYIATFCIDDRKNTRQKHIGYDIKIQTDDIIFSSKKHLDKYYANIKTSTRKYAREYDHVNIKEIRKVRVDDARCIYIDDPMHLYITRDFIVTHNTSAAVMTVAEPSLDPRFRAVYLRNNLGDLRSGGGILDEFRKIYGKGCTVIESGDPHIDFPSGARIDVTHIADQSKDKVLQRFKGRQYDFIYFDEGTGFTWECFTAVYSRNRGMASWTGKVRMTTNPKRSHWLRKFLDWYIGGDGFIIPERDGVVRYFYINGETVDDVVWGDSKEEVYLKCKVQIDRVLRRFNGKNGKATPHDMIKSFTFYEGKMSGNKAILESNAGYIGSAAVMGGREAQANLEGNWNVDTDEDLDAPIDSITANSVFLADPQINNDRWITCDLADTGTDNFLALAWDGFHIIDILILGKTTPRENADRLQDFAVKHDVSNSHIIYDAIRGTYINDYIPEANPFISYRAPMGMYGRMVYNLKTECYMRMIEMMKRGGMSMEDSVAKKIYEHQNLKTSISVQSEFMEECSVVRFKDMPSGKQCLLSKKEMNAKLGKSRSMDLLDPCAMRMMPVLEYAYGEELINTMVDEREDDIYSPSKVNIYDNSMWGTS